MNHQFFVDKIFEGPNDLSEQQTYDLSIHLETCESCRDLIDSYRNLETVLHSSEQVEPEAGFVSRWQARMEEKRSRSHRRQTFLTLAFVTCGLGLLLGISAYLAWPLVRAPGLLLWSWVYQLFTLFTFADSVRELISALLNQGEQSVPLIFWVFGLGMISQLAVLWVVSYRVLTNPRRVTA